MSSTVITTTPRRKRKNPAFRKLSYGRPTGSNRKRPRLQQQTRMVVPVGRGPVPQKTIITLRYQEAWLSDGLTLDKRFNLNSLFSPVFSGGHQPLGFDQYTTFYNRYRVTKVRVTLYVGGSTSYSGGCIKTILVPDNDTTALTNMSTASEQRGASCHVGNDRFGPMRITRVFYPNRISGVSMKEYQDDRFQALMTAKPTESIMLHVCLTDIYNNTPAASIVQASAVFDYTCELFDPNPLAAS